MTPTGFNVILCPVDFSPIAANALRHAVRFAACFGGRVVAAHVVWFHVPPYFTESRIEEFRQQARASFSEARAALGSFVEATLGDGADVELAVVEGSPTPAILKLVADHGADLIVMGTHGRTGINRWMLGSVAERVIRESPVPVLTARSAPAAEFHRVLAAVNDTELSRRVLAQAAALASHCAGSLSVVNVHDPHGDAPIADLCQWVPESIRSGCSVEQVVRYGDAAGEIISAAAETAAGLLVIGATERGFFQGSVLSRTALRVIRQSPCPVLSIRAVLPG